MRIGKESERGRERGRREERQRERKRKEGIFKSGEKVNMASRILHFSNEKLSLL